MNLQRSYTQNGATAEQTGSFSLLIVNTLIKPMFLDQNGFFPRWFKSNQQQSLQTPNTPNENRTIEWNGQLNQCEIPLYCSIYVASNF